MTDVSQPTPTPPAAPPSPPSAPWHSGVEPEILGHWQNKGWKIDDPKEVALAATKQAREAEKHFGVPTEQLLKMPKADAKPEDVTAFWRRLGAVEAKDYDLSGIKFSDGEGIDDAFAATWRDALAAAYVSKDRAGIIVDKVVKHLEAAEKAMAAEKAVKLAAEKIKLKTDWGPNYDFNHLKAMEGARRLGISPQAINNMENELGYADVMEKMRQIGHSTSEDTFVERGVTGGSPTTQSGAIARKAELLADQGFVERFLKNGVAEKREMEALDRMITGIMDPV